MGKSKLTGEQRKYAIMAFAAGCTPKAVHHDLRQQGAEITYSAIKMLRRRSGEEIQAATKDLADVLPSIDKDKRIAAREIDIQRIENRLTAKDISHSDYNALMRTKNSIRDSIAKEQEGFGGRVHINQHTTIAQREKPEEWWKKLIRERQEAQKALETHEKLEPQGRESRILEISGPDEEE